MDNKRGFIRKEKKDSKARLHLKCHVKMTLQLSYKALWYNHCSLIFSSLSQRNLAKLALTLINQLEEQLDQCEKVEQMQSNTWGESERDYPVLDMGVCLRKEHPVVWGSPKLLLKTVSRISTRPFHASRKMQKTPSCSQTKAINHVSRKSATLNHIRKEKQACLFGYSNMFVTSPSPEYLHTLFFLSSSSASNRQVFASSSLV